MFKKRIELGSLSKKMELGNPAFMRVPGLFHSLRCYFFKEVAVKKVYVHLHIIMLTILKKREESH